MTSFIYSTLCIMHSDICCHLCVRHTDAVQCLAFNPVIQALMSCAWTDIGKSVVLHVECLSLEIGMYRSQ